MLKIFLVRSVFSGNNLATSKGSYGVFPYLGSIDLDTEFHSSIFNSVKTTSQCHCANGPLDKVRISAF